MSTTNIDRLMHHFRLLGFDLRSYRLNVLTESTLFYFIPAKLFIRLQGSGFVLFGERMELGRQT